MSPIVSRWTHFKFLHDTYTHILHHVIISPWRGWWELRRIEWVTRDQAPQVLGDLLWHKRSCRQGTYRCFYFLTLWLCLFWLFTLQRLGPEETARNKHIHKTRRWRVLAGTPSKIGLSSGSQTLRWSPGKCLFRKKGVPFPPSTPINLFRFLTTAPDSILVDKTPTHNTHLCNTVCSQARNASHALGSRIRFLSCRLPRANHLRHSPFLPPRHQNTHHDRDNTIISKNTQYIISLSRLSQSTSSAIKNHSGVKTCRVAETRARQLHKLWAQRTCDRLKDRSLCWRSTSIIWCAGKNLDKKITELLTLKKWRHLEKLAQLVCWILNYQGRPTSNRRCMSTIAWKALQILTSKMDSYKRCWLHHCMFRKLLGNPMHCFHLNKETWSGILCSKTLIRRIWEDLFLNVTKSTY